MENIDFIVLNKFVDNREVIRLRKQSKIKIYLGRPVIAVLLVGWLVACNSTVQNSSNLREDLGQSETVTPKNTSDPPPEQAIKIDSTNFRERGLRLLTAPKRPIQTPWGVKEVYDPTQDPEVRAVYQSYMDSGFLDVTSQENILRMVREDGREYYKYLGCSFVRDATCLPYDFSGCEGLEPGAPCSAINLPPVAVLIGSCTMNGKRHEYFGYQKTSDFEDSISQFFNFECLKWKE